MRENTKAIRRVCEIAVTAALLSVSANIYIPMPVPFTLQTLILFISLFTLGAKITTVATAVYISLGAVGMPVFSGFSGGIARLFDATGGYILGMLFGALIYWLLEHFVPKRGAYMILLSSVTLFVIYLLGSLWYVFIYGGEGSIGFVLISCVLPFIIPDAFKIYIAYIISKRVPRS